MEDNTSYQLSYTVNDGIVEIVFTGEITKNTLADRLPILHSSQKSYPLAEYDFC